MNSDRFKKIEEIYHAVLEIPAGKRPLFLQERCGDDPALKKEIEAMLYFEDTADSFLDASPGDLAAEMLSAREKQGKNLVNRQIGRYKILKVLGEGGMGTVYFARDTRLARPVALKVFPPEMVENKDRLHRFVHEARSASALNHPHILTVYEIDEFTDEDGRTIHYISTEFIDGETLRDLIHSPETSVKDLLKYLGQAATGLAKAHAAGIVHRDLKPENIMVSGDGYAKILDFGLAKLTDPENDLHRLQRHKSRSGVILGTLGYMSPEQAQGKSEIDERSDIFSFGCILYEAITRRRAFEGESAVDSLHRIIHSDPVPAERSIRGLSSDLKDLLERCLIKNPAERFPTIAGVAAVLQNIPAKDLDKIQNLNEFDNVQTIILERADTTPTDSGQFSEQRRQVTVLFGSFAVLNELLEDLDPEEAAEKVNRLWGVIDRSITKGGGRTGERLNDTFTAIWGTGETSESDPENAVRTALKLQREISELPVETLNGHFDRNGEEKPDLLKIGISTGTVLLGNIRDTGEFVPTGSPVNQARRILSQTPFGKIHISHDTYRHIRGVFNVEEVSAKEGKDIQTLRRRTRTYSISGIKPRAFRVANRGVEGIETEMFGREGELAKMLEAFETVIEIGELQIVGIIGEAGLGKSRLLFEFEDRLELRPEKFFIFKARALEAMSDLPYALVRDLFSFRFEIGESDSQSLTREKFVRGILEMIDDRTEGFGPSGPAEMKAHFIGHLIGFDFSDSPHIRGILDDEQQIQDRAWQYAAQFFSAICQKLPTVIYLDDLHWADNESLDFFDFIGDKCAGEPVLMVESARPILFEKRPHRGEGRENRLTLELQTLTKHQSYKLIENILQKAANVPPAFRDLIFRNAGGNPFYVEELIKMLIERDVIETGGEAWRINESRLGEIPVPPTLTGVLQARLDKLTVWEKRILQRASVIGREFWEDALGDFEENVSVPTVLNSLRNKELLFRREGSKFGDAKEYVFKHALLRDVTYETVLLQERRKWHAETARWLISTSGERESEYCGVIAEHFERAKKTEEAADWFGRAGKQAQKSYASKVAEKYYRRALRFWETLPEEDRPEFLTARHLLKWKTGLAKAVYNQAKFAEAIELHREILGLAEKANDPEEQTKAFIELSVCFLEIGDPRSSLDEAKRAVELIGKLEPGDETHFLKSRGLYRQGRALMGLGEFDEGIKLAERVLEISKDFSRERSVQKANSFHLLGSFNMTLGRLRQAREFEEKGVEISRQAGDRRTVGNGLNSLGFQAYMSGDGKTAMGYYAESLEIAREVGNKTGEIMVLSNMGGALVCLGEYERAENDLKKIIAEVGETGHFVIHESHRFLAEALIGQGKFEEALMTAEKALDLAETAESHGEIGENWRVLGIISSLLKRDVLIGKERFNADDCFAKSLEIFREFKMEVNHAQTLHNFAHHLVSLGDQKKAEELLREERKISARLEIDTPAKSKYFDFGF
ncbi:MAG: protein kinase [Pyrinomonadaceae bacterium]